MAVDLRQGEQWNDNLLNEFFKEVDISAIKAIQIRKAPCQNRWVMANTLAETISQLSLHTIFSITRCLIYGD